MKKEEIFELIKNGESQDVDFKEGCPTNSEISEKLFSTLKIPISLLSTQKQIVSQIEEEQTLVNANKKLIELFEKKIADKISEVWGNDALDNLA